MTITEAKTTPVPASVLLTRQLRLAKVAMERADSEAAEARARYETLQAEHRAVRAECAA